MSQVLGSHKVSRSIKAVSIILGVLAFDLVSKHYAALMIEPRCPIEVTGVFNLVNVKNVGAAFGMMAGMGNVFFIAVSVVAIGFIAYMLAGGRMGYVALSMILGGALGNLTDRMVYGYVRDFLDFHIAGHHWPAFNVADSALTVGLAIMILGSFVHPVAPTVSTEDS